MLQEDPQRGIATVLLARPEVRNAFNPQMIAELTDCFAQLALREADELRAVVLRGQGGYFCSGGDLNWMRSMAAFSANQNHQDALELAEMLATVYSCPAPLLAVVEGGAYGGALGLLCCCDIVLADAASLFAFSEVRLGIAPATIAPYVLIRLLPAAAGHLLLSAERFDTQMAQRSGLVQHSAETGGLEKLLTQQLNQLLASGPVALRETKSLLRALQPLVVNSELQEHTARLIARLRVSLEGQEGLSAFLEKRHAAWVTNL